MKRFSLWLPLVGSSAIVLVLALSLSKLRTHKSTDHDRPKTYSAINSKGERAARNIEIVENRQSTPESVLHQTSHPLEPLLIEFSKLWKDLIGKPVERGLETTPVLQSLANPLIASIASEIAELAKSDPSVLDRAWRIAKDRSQDPAIREFLIYVLSPRDFADPASDTARSLIAIALEPNSEHDIRFAAVSGMWKMHLFSMSFRTENHPQRNSVLYCQKPRGFMSDPNVAAALLHFVGADGDSTQLSYQAIMGLLASDVPPLMRLARQTVEYSSDVKLKSALNAVDWRSLRSSDEYIWEDSTQFSKHKIGRELEDPQAYEAAVNAMSTSTDLDVRRMALSAAVSDSVRIWGRTSDELLQACSKSLSESDPVLNALAIEGIARSKNGAFAVTLLSPFIERTGVAPSLKLAALRGIALIPGPEVDSFLQGIAQGTSLTESSLRKAAQALDEARRSTNR